MDAAFDIVVAADEERGIGKDGTLPWRLPGDMRYFRDLTSKVSDRSRQNAVVMGRKTWESIPEKRRPLPDRINVVITRSPHYQVPEGVITVASLQDALEALQSDRVERCFVIGGGEIYRQALDHPGCHRLYLTQVQGKHGCDTFFPPYEERFRTVVSSEPREENGQRYRFLVLERL